MPTHFVPPAHDTVNRSLGGGFSRDNSRQLCHSRKMGALLDTGRMPAIRTLGTGPGWISELGSVIGVTVAPFKKAKKPRPHAGIHPRFKKQKQDRPA